MNTQIVYVLVANEKDLYLEEFWTSLYSLRIFHPEVTVKVLVDDLTEKYLRNFTQLCDMITEIVVVPIPEEYNAKQRSRFIKTTVRNVIDGVFLFLDTDTVICKPLDEIDNIGCDIAAVPDCHLPCSEHISKPINEVKRIYDTNVSDAEFWFNSGVMYVKDNELTHNFYKRWNENWKYSCSEKGNSQDQFALLKTDKEFGYIIEHLSDIYNCQVAVGLKYFTEAAIVHWWSMGSMEGQSPSPYFSLEIYKEIKTAGKITPGVERQIKNCKQSFVSPTMPVGREYIHFLASPAGQIFNNIYRDGGAASFLMSKIAGWLDKIHRITKKTRS